MKRVLYAASRAEINEPQAADNLKKLIMKVRNGDMGATAQLLLRYHKQVVSVAFDVLQDETRAKESARETLESAVKQLQQGIRTGEFEPWLMWLTRSDALRYTQFERPAKAPAKQPELKIAQEDTEEPADANIAHIMSKYASELGEVPRVVPRSARSEKSPLQADPVQNDDTLPRNMHRSKETETGEEAETVRRKLRLKRPQKLKNTGLTVAMAMLCVILLWFVFGLVAKNIDGNLLDLGYSWFNNNLFPLF